MDHFPGYVTPWGIYFILGCLSSPLVMAVMILHHFPFISVENTFVPMYKPPY